MLRLLVLNLTAAAGLPYHKAATSRSFRSILQWAWPSKPASSIIVTGEQLVMQRLGFLNLTAAAGLPPAEVLRHYLVAACDSQDAQVKLNPAFPPFPLKVLRLPSVPEAGRHCQLNSRSLAFPHLLFYKGMALWSGNLVATLKHAEIGVCRSRCSCASQRRCHVTLRSSKKPRLNSHATNIYNAAVL